MVGGKYLPVSEHAETRGDSLELLLFGVPAISWRNVTLSILRRQVRALLFRLADTVEPVSRSYLCFLFWPDVPESQARRNLSRLLSYLKRDLPNQRILRIDGEYIGLDKATVRSDTRQFARLCNSDRAPSAVLNDRETAVALYRGQFLDGHETTGQSEYANWLHDRRRAYERSYLETLDKIIDTHTNNGDFATAAEYARRYLAADELAEDVHRRLIKLYEALGQREQALRQLAQCTQTLDRELGVKPLPETIAAASTVKAIEGYPPSSPVIEPSWAIIPSLDLPLIGREAAWKELQSVTQGHPDGSLILISGEAGIGKSRILQEFATSRRQLVLTGNSHASTRMLPYQPLLQALRLALGYPQLWEDIRPIWLAELSQLLPELDELYPDLPEPIIVPAQQAKSRTLEAFTQVFWGLAKNASPLILCLDDLHWADEETQGWLMFAGNRLAHSRLYILGTFRSEEAQAVRRIREAATRKGILNEVVLNVLPVSAVQQILAYLPKQLNRQENLASRLHETTGGNTLFLLETMRMLLEQETDIESVTEMPLPESVQTVILNHAARLSPLALQVLETTTVLSPDLGFDLIRQTTGRSESEVVRGLDELTTKQLLQCAGGSCQFRHDLIRTAVYQDLSPWRRRLLHRRAAEALTSVYGTKTGQVAGQIAQHFDVAGEQEQAAKHYEAAAVAAQKAHAHESAVVYWRRVIELALSLNKDDETLGHFHEEFGDSLAYSGQHAEARCAYETALSHTPPMNNLWRASIQGKLANNYQHHDSFEDAAAAFQLALSILGTRLSETTEAWWRTWFQIQLDFWDLLYFNARDQEMAELANKLKGLIKQYGNDADRYAYYFHEGQRRYRITRFGASEWPIEAMRLSLHYAHRVGDPMMIGQAQFGLGFGLLWNSEWDSSLAELRGALALVERIAHRPLQTQCLAYITLAQRLRGSINGVRATIEEAQQSAFLQGEQIYIGHALANHAWLYYREGAFSQALQHAQDAGSHWPPPYPLQWMAHFIILAASLAEGHLEGAIESANIMLRPVEKRHPEELVAPLEQATRCWENEEYQETEKYLQEAVVQAQRLNYL